MQTYFPDENLRNVLPIDKMHMECVSHSEVFKILG